MTCIVGFAQDGRVHIAGDSAGVAGLDLRIRHDQKVFKNADMVFGCTTSFRMIQLLRYKLQVPKRHPDMDVMAYMTTVFIDAVRSCLKEGGFAARKEDVESGGTFLVGYSGRLFRIDSDYQVGECVDNFDACGCGEPYALGALLMTVASKKPPIELLLGALSCAQYFSAGVQGPFVHESGGTV